MRRLTISMLVLIGFLFCFNASSFAAPPTTSGTATFLGTDTTTQGGWQGTYGTVGSYIPNGPSVTPTDGSTFNPGAAALYTWGTNVASGSALKTGGGMNIASCWYRNLGNASPSLTLDVDVPSGSQTVALYLLDYDKQGRSESVAVTDLSNNPLDGPHAVSGTNFANGEYLLWTITGEVHITITLVNGPNAVASGIFFGQNSMMPPPATAGAYITTKSGSIGSSDSLTTLASLSLPAGTYIIHANASFLAYGTDQPLSSCLIADTTKVVNPSNPGGAIASIDIVSAPAITVGPSTFTSWQTVLDVNDNLPSTGTITVQCASNNTSESVLTRTVLSALPVPSIIVQ